MQHGKRGHQEPTALKPNCNIPFFKTYFPYKNKKNKTLPKAETHNGTNPNPQARHRFHKFSKQNSPQPTPNLHHNNSYNKSSYL